MPTTPCDCKCRVVGGSLWFFSGVFWEKVFYVLFFSSALCCENTGRLERLKERKRRKSWYKAKRRSWNGTWVDTVANRMGKTRRRIEQPETRFVPSDSSWEHPVSTQVPFQSRGLALYEECDQTLRIPFFDQTCALTFYRVSRGRCFYPQHDLQCHSSVRDFRANRSVTHHVQLCGKN